MYTLRLRAFVCALAVVAFTLGATPVSPMGTVKQFVDDFNKGDLGAASALCVAPGGIIDEFPPHQWASCTDWAKAFVTFGKQDGDTNAVVTLGAPSHVDITGKVAYVVVPTTYAYKHHGKPVTESGSTWTLILSMTPAGWRITSWAWAAGKST